MKTLIKTISIICTCCLVFLMTSCVTPLKEVEGAEVANWQGNKKAAVSLTFDDWSSGQFANAVPELNKRNMPGTFYIYTNNVSNWSNVVKTASEGHEIGNHSVSHCCTGELGEGIREHQYESEVLGAKKILEKHIPRIYTFCYPYGLNYDVSSFHDFLRETGHIAARSVIEPDPIHLSYDFAQEDDDYFRLRTANIESYFTSVPEKYATFQEVTEDDFARYTQRITDVIDGGGYLTFTYHGIDCEDWAWANITTDLFREYLDILENYRDDLWVATVADAIKYHRQVKSGTKIEEVKAPSKDKWVIRLTHGLEDKETFNQPMTIMLPTNGKEYKKITQNGQSLPFTVSDGTIMFDAVPDGSNIVLEI